MRARTILGAMLITTMSLAGSGCGVTLKLGSPPNSSPTRVLTATELQDGLIRRNEVGSDFRSDDPNEPDDPDKPLGCISDLGTVTKSAAHRAVRMSAAVFRADSDFSYPQVFDTIRTYRTEQDAATVMSGLAAALARCHTVDHTSSDGLRIRLDVSTDERLVGPEVTRQINIYAFGHLSSAQFNIPMRAEYGLLQVGNQVLFLCYVNAADDVSAQAEAVVRLGLARLIAVLKHRAVPDGLDLDLKVTDPDKVLTPAGQPGASA